MLLPATAATAPPESQHHGGATRGQPSRLRSSAALCRAHHTPPRVGAPPPLPGSAACTLLELRCAPIGARARKHLVDAQHVPRVHTDTQVERVLSGVLHHVLVARHTSSLKRLRGELLLLDGHQMRRERKLLDAVLLLAGVVDANLRVCARCSELAEPGSLLRLCLRAPLLLRRPGLGLCVVCTHRARHG